MDSIPSGASRDFSTVMRQALRATAEGKTVDPSRLGLSEDDAAALAVVLQFARFALAIDMGVKYFLMELSVGAQLNTVQARTSASTLPSRLVAALEGREGGARGLDEVLDRDRRFLIQLNESYMEAIPEGCRALLDHLSPKSVRDRNKLPFGLLRGAALDELEQTHAAVRDLPPSDVFQEFFQAAFRKALARATGARMQDGP